MRVLGARTLRGPRGSWHTGRGTGPSRTVLVPIVLSAVVLKSSVGLLPVLLFLAVLVALDSYKLVRWRTLAATLATGFAAAAIGYVINVTSWPALGVEPVSVVRYAAPALEEALKAVVVVYLIRTHRVGFLVDAGICGFAVGAGFAVLENVYYLHLLPGAGPGAWVLRGFGTAIMHGGTTAVVAMVSKSLLDREIGGRWLLFLRLPG